VAKQEYKQGLQISWTTITYRSVLLAIFAVVLLIGIVSFVLLPTQSKQLLAKTGDFLTDMLAKVGVVLDKAGSHDSAAGPQQAHFTALDGTVRVKKVNSNSWVTADYNLPLEKGDVVQTGSEGMAKVVFADQTSYTVKQDSLIVVEDNSVNANQQTQVSVQVTTGTVDLNTSTYSAGSSSQVRVAGATASFAPDSSAQVHNDPKADQHEILVKRGAGEVVRGSETVQLSNFEKVSFGDQSPLVRSKVLGPPTLIGPSNMTPIFSSSKEATVQFTWTPMDNVTGYRLRVSRNPYFSSTVLDESTKSPALLAHLPEGAYYWVVQSTDGSGKESVESEKNRFTIIPKGSESVSIPLDLESFVQHGHLIEIRGKTEVNAKVMVNGQEVPFIQGDGSFQFMTPPLPNGENVLTITAQNSKGGVNTKQKKIVIQ